MLKTAFSISKKYLSFTLLYCLLSSSQLWATQSIKDTLIINNGNFDENIQWLDTHGDTINAHDGGIIEFNGVYYWYGLALRPLGRDTGENNGAATTTGINLYSSKDLHRWNYEGVILKTSHNKDHPLRAPMRMERPKMLYNKKTKKFVLWFHFVGYPGNHGQEIGYADAGVAVSNSIKGPFKFLGHHRPIDELGAVKDCTLFMDNDSTAYFIYDRKIPDGTRCLHVVKLTDDYLHASNQWKKIDVANRREAPVVIKQNNIYYLVTSDVSGWKVNAAKVYSATNIMGPWKEIGNPCVGPEMASTYNTQSTHAFRMNGKTQKTIIMMERHNTDNFFLSSYVWLPVEFTADQKLTIPYMKTWVLHESEEVHKK